MGSRRGVLVCDVTGAARTAEAGVAVEARCGLDMVGSEEGWAM